MIKINDDYEPSFRVRLIQAEANENKSSYWEQYDTLKKSWFRLCDQCTEQVYESSESLCTNHYKIQQEALLKSRNMGRKLKRLNTNVTKKYNTRKNPLESKSDTKTEENVSGENEEINEPLGMVISVTSSLSRKQTSQVKEFITKFHTHSQSIEFTCESQPDYIDDTTTHVITNDSGEFTTTLSKEIIQACVHHIFIGSIKWITSSLEQSSLLDHFPYEILREKKSLKTSRGIKQCRFDQLPVFPSSTVISIECHAGIKSMKLSRDELIEIIELSGATLLNDCVQYKTLFILCSSKKEMIKRKEQNDDEVFLKINENMIYYCKPEFLFDSIVRHEVQAIEKYLW